MSLTIFYDGRCPLCLAEMRQLHALNKQGKLRFEDIHAENFQQRFPDINSDAAARILHGRLETGELLLGLDVTHRAWSLVGKKRWLAALRWPLIRPVADLAYRVFARHRYRLSRLLTGQARCQSDCRLGAARRDQ